MNLHGCELGDVEFRDWLLSERVALVRQGVEELWVNRQEDEVCEATAESRRIARCVERITNPLEGGDDGGK